MCDYTTNSTNPLYLIINESIEEGSGKEYSMLVPIETIEGTLKSMKQNYGTKSDILLDQ